MDFLAVDAFLAGAFFAADFLAGAFFAGCWRLLGRSLLRRAAADFLAGAFFAVELLDDFFAGAFFAVECWTTSSRASCSTLLGGVFFAADFLAGARLGR